MSHSISDGAKESGAAGRRSLFTSSRFLYSNCLSVAVGALRGDSSFSLTLEICMNDWREKPTFCCDVAATTGGWKTTRSRAVSVRLYSSSRRSKEMDAHLYRLYWCYLIAGQQQLSWCALPVARTTQQVSLLLLGFYFYFYVCNNLKVFFFLVHIFVYLSQYFKWYIIYFSMIFLNEGIVVLNSIPFTRVFDVSFRCVAVDFNEELWRRGEKKLCKKRRGARGRWTFTSYRPLGAFFSVRWLQLIGLTTEHICFFI